MASMGLCLHSQTFLSRMCPTRHGGDPGGPCVYSHFSMGIWESLLSLHDLAIGVVWFCAVLLQAALNCLCSTR